MREVHAEREIKNVYVTDDIFCNQCGKSCKCYHGMGYEGLVEVTVSGGYGSKFGDMVDYSFSICEDCLETMFATFKHPPAKSDRLDYTEPENKDEETKPGTTEEASQQ